MRLDSQRTCGSERGIDVPIAMDRHFFYLLDLLKLVRKNNPRDKGGVAWIQLNEVKCFVFGGA